MNEDLSEMASAYAMFRGLELTGYLGSGLEGTVWKVRGKQKHIAWALKMQRESAGYRRERDCYERLLEHGITEVAGFNVRVLVHADDQWRTIEMSIVDRPFIVDFAQAYLDEPPDFPPEVWAERRETWERSYGGRWPEVRRALAALESMGIYYLDVHRNNVAL